MQLAFFIQRKRSLRRTPKCIRGITIVKAGGDLSHSKLKGAVAPEEILTCPPGRMDGNDGGDFIDIDPKEGFSVRNFQIQACKMATVSDIVVYGDNQTPRSQVIKLAKGIAKAQAAWLRKFEGPSHEGRTFNTFVVSGKSGLVRGLEIATNKGQIHTRTSRQTTLISSPSTPKVA